MSRVVSAIESLYNNLPPTLTTTQVNSVRKKMKTELVGLIKHPAAYEFIDKLTPMLIDLGYTQQDITKMLPKAEERRKYCKRSLSMESLQIYNKKPRLDPHIDFDNDTNDSETQDFNEVFLMENFKLEKVVQLVISSMSQLPAQVPNEFIKEYGKYVEDGKIGNVNFLTKTLANYLTDAGINLTKFVSKEEVKVVEKEAEEDKEEKERVCNQNL